MNELEGRWPGRAGAVPGPAGGFPGRPQGRLAGVDLETSADARVHDVLLGSSRCGSLPVDRAVARGIQDAFPHVRRSVQAARRCMLRMVHHLARLGVSQFLDIGAGLPAVPDLHHVAQQIQPEVRMLYVDRDPLVPLRHSMRSPSRGRACVASMQGDLLRPPAWILQSHAAECLFDLTRPVALLLGSVLDRVSDEDDPHGRVGEFVKALPRGSYLALTHATADFAPAPVAAAREAYTRGGLTFRPRPWREVEAFFRGGELLEPGVESARRWRPSRKETAIVLDDAAVSVYGGVGRVPDTKAGTRPPGTATAPDGSS